MAKRRRMKRRPIPQEPVTVTIESLSHEGRGITHVQGKTVFVDCALPGEEVVMEYTHCHSKYDEAKVLEVLTPSAMRVPAKCPHFEICGGCSSQHMAPEVQIERKQSILKEHLQHFGGLEPQQWLPPMQKALWGYRRKARLGVKYVPKKGGCLVGFREKRTPFITQIDFCDVLDEQVANLITPLRELITDMDSRASTPQIEVAVGDDKVALVVRHLEPLSESDQQSWLEFARQRGLELYLQPKGPKTVHKIWPQEGEDRLCYQMPEFNLEMKFHPMDFTQVNADINRSMVPLALQLLAPEKGDRVLDLFCGLGNFTLPLASQAGHVVGVEGDDEMVKRGYENAEHNGIDNVEFHQADLQADFTQADWASQGFDKILIDPPRSGALDIVRYLPAFGAKRIVYVSCNPATLARDAGELAKHGFKLIKAGVMDMFPHTAHVESIALFEKTEPSG